ncbi:MAG: SCO family protein [Litorilinea sp.]
MTSQAETVPTWHEDKLSFSRLWYIVLVVPIVAALAFVIFQPVQVLPRIELAPGYSLVDQHGNRFTSEDVRGHLTLYTITYSHCGAGCPETSATMRTVQTAVNELSLGDLPTAFVSISIDPTRDTPERLAEFARQVGADGENWRFVTGDPSHLKQIIGAGFGTYYDATQADAIPFDPIYVLVDGWGIKRAVYRTGAPDLETLQRDFMLIAREVENSEGVNRFAYEAAHLFLCYPS